MSFFDGSQVDESELKSFDPLPDGEYICMVKKCELKGSQNTAGCKYFSTQYEVVKGPKAGRMIFSTFVTEHPNEKVRNIGRARMKLLCLAATGKPVVNAAEELTKKPIMVKIKTTKDKNTGQDSTNVLDIKPTGTTVAPVKTASAPTEPMTESEIPF